MMHKRGLRAFVYGCGVALCGLLLSCAGPLETADARPGSAQEQQLVSFYFSAEVWGGVPFTDAQKQQVMVEAMLSGERSHLEREVVHLLDTPGVQVRRFAAVFEVNGSVRPPAMRSGYELELLVPRGREALMVELVNGETGVVNLVRVAPGGF